MRESETSLSFCAFSARATNRERTGLAVILAHRRVRETCGLQRASLDPLSLSLSYYLNLLFQFEPFEPIRGAVQISCSS